MFGNKKLAELEQRLQHYQNALQRVASHVGINEHHQSPELLSKAICDGIDALLGKEPAKEPSLGSQIRLITSNVRKIKLSGAVDLVVTQGSEPRLEVFANDSSDLKKIVTSVSGDCLTVDNEPMMIVGNGRGVTQIITGNGNTQIAGRDYFEGGSVHIGRNIGTVFSKVNSIEQRSGPLGLRVEVRLPNVSSLRISGAGNVTYRDIQHDEFSLDVSGAGSIEVTGKVNRLEADVSGAGNIDAYQLTAAHGRLRVSGAGNIKATATESVVARVSGVGKIKIAGNPSQRDTDVSGIGKIKFVDGN